jgi:hypothetical protein
MCKSNDILYTKDLANKSTFLKGALSGAA